MNSTFSSVFGYHTIGSYTGTLYPCSAVLKHVLSTPAICLLPYAYCDAQTPAALRSRLRLRGRRQCLLGPGKVQIGIAALQGAEWLIIDSAAELPHDRTARRWRARWSACRVRSCRCSSRGRRPLLRLRAHSRSPLPRALSRLHLREKIGCTGCARRTANARPTRRIATSSASTTC